ncbi:MAG: sodium/proton-translocating pyrophosphatase, partial [Calditrichia bacterium]|nr:sodium/proton-translocating pyrophosphatase [Calditrichia bacterium]
MESYLLASFSAAIIALIYAIFKMKWIGKQDPGDKTMVEISNYIKEGAMAFLAREYRVLSIFVVVVAVILAIINTGVLRLTSVSFVVGALLSALAGYLGMRAATLSNVRTTNKAKESLVGALN